MLTATPSWVPGYISARLTRRRFLRGAAAGAGAVALISCGGGGGSDGALKFADAATSRQPGTVWLAKNDWTLAEETKQAVRGGIHRGFRASDPPSHLDPIPQVSTGVPHAVHVYEMLMSRSRGPGIEAGSTAYINPVGSLAESWEMSPDATTYTFTMRQGVKFQDIAPVNGRVMDIDDWKTSHERHMATGPYRVALGDTLAKVEYPDKNHMVWTFKQPYIPILDRIYADDFAYFIMPKELNANPSLAETNAIGTGYKILDKAQPAITLEYRKNPTYWGGDPFIERWHEPIIPEYANQYAQFVRGNIISFTPTARDVMLLRNDAPGTVIVANDIRQSDASIHKWGKFNPQQRPWKDPRVRIAFRRGIDYARIAQFLSNRDEFEARGIPVEILTTTHVVNHPSWWLDPEKGELGALSQNYLFDVAEAKKLTAAAGYNQPIDLPYFVNTTGELPDAEAAVQKSLTDGGVFKVDLRRTPSSEYRVLINVEGQFEGIQQQNGGSNELDYQMFRYYHSSNIGGVPFPDAKLDQLAEAQRREGDFEKRVGIAKEIQLHLAQTFLQNPGRSIFTTFGFRWPWVHNSNYGAYPDRGSHLQWLDENMPNRNNRI